MGKPSLYQRALGHMGQRHSRPEANITRQATKALAKEQQCSRRRIVKKLKRNRIKERLENWKYAG